MLSAEYHNICLALTTHCANYVSLGDRQVRPCFPASRSGGALPGRRLVERPDPDCGELHVAGTRLRIALGRGALELIVPPSGSDAWSWFESPKNPEIEDP